MSSVLVVSWVDFGNSDLAAKIVVSCTTVVEEWEEVVMLEVTLFSFVSSCVETAPIPLSGISCNSMFTSEDCLPRRVAAKASSPSSRSLPRQLAASVADITDMMLCNGDCVAG